VTISRPAPAVLRPGVVLVPLSGLPPFRLAPLWSIFARNRWIQAFTELAARIGADADWLDAGGG